MKKLFLLLIILILLIAAEGAYLIFGPGTAFKSASYDLYIHTGMNYQDLDSMLRNDDVLTHPAFFNWLANRISYPSSMKAGKYEIREGMSLFNILKNVA